MTARQILFRVDGGRRRGLSLGHAFRCLALAEEIGKAALVRFVMKDYAEGVDLVSAAGFPVRAINREIKPDTQAALLAEETADTIVFDLPELETGILRRLLDAGKRVIVIDDRGGKDDKPIHAQALINGSIAEEARRYPESHPGCACYLGPRYGVIGRQFDGGERTAVADDVGTILLTFGGSDPSGLTLKAVAALAAMAARPPAAKLNVVLGPGFGDSLAVRKIIDGSPGGFHIFSNAPNLCALILEADLVVAAAGVTAYELAATGTPAILIPSIGHETTAAAAFAEAGTAVNLGPWDSGSAKRLAEAIAALASEKDGIDARDAMCRRGPQAVDGKGRCRVAEIILGGRF